MEISLAVSIDHLLRTQAVRLVHPHIQVSIKTNRETTIGLIELVRGNTQISQYPIHRDSVVQTAKIFEVTEILVDEFKAVIIDSITLRIRILVKSQQTASGTKFSHNSPGMTTASKSYINIGSLWSDIQTFDTLFQHYRSMITIHLPLSFLHHPSPPRPVWQSFQARYLIAYRMLPVPKLLSY